MRFILALFLTALLAIALGTFLPWWTIAIAAFSVALAVPVKPGLSFLAGFLGVFVGWAAIAIVRDAANDGILSQKIATDTSSWRIFGCTDHAFRVHGALLAVLPHWRDLTYGSSVRPEMFKFYSSRSVFSFNFAILKFCSQGKCP